MKLLVAAVTLCAVVAVGSHAEASIRSRNKIDHFKHYRTCSTCPRTKETVIDYGPSDGKLNNRIWKAAAVNRYGEYVFYVWERGRIYYQGGKCTSKPDWSAGSYRYPGSWNYWHEEGRDPVSGSGPGYRYRRVMFHMIADPPWWTFRKDKYVGMTLRCDGTWAPAG